MKLGKVIVTNNSDDANLQTIIIVNSHHITEAQYTCMYQISKGGI